MKTRHLTTEQAIEHWATQAEINRAAAGKLLVEEAEFWKRRADALQRRLDALAAREPTPDEIAALREHITGSPLGWDDLSSEAWIIVRDALLASTAQEPPALSPADTLDGAEEMLRRIAATACLDLDATEAGAIVAELDRLRARLDAEDAQTLIEHGRKAERAAIVSWLSAQQYGLTAADISRGDHLARKEPPPRDKDEEQS